MNIQCPRCARKYDADADCHLFQSRPMRDCARATVVCECGAQLEVQPQRKPVAGGVLGLLRQRWAYRLRVKER